MKFSWLAIAFVSINAFACPDVSGVYVSQEGTPVKLVMQECKTLTRYIGEIDAAGNVKFPETGMFFLMDGKPNCGIRNFCTTIKPFADRIEVKLNFQSGVVTDDHGQCSQNAYDLSLDKDGHLLADYQVTNCADGFSGAARKTSKKL